MCTPCPSEMRVLEIAKGFPGGSDREDCLQCGRPGFDLQIWKIPWRREWQPAPLFFFFCFRSSILAWRIPWTEEPGGLQSTRLQRVRHD